MSGHLTGWRVSAGDEHSVFDGRGAKLASVPCGGLSGRTFDQGADAARLIAAAPCLLEALEALVAKSTDVDGDWSNEWRAALNAIAKAKAAVQKAKGESA